MCLLSLARQPHRAVTVADTETREVFPPFRTDGVSLNVTLLEQPPAGLQSA